MSDRSISVAAGLEHRPHGNGNFYNPEPVERQPHEPKTDQAIEIGAATWPMGSVDRVWVTWNADGQPAGEAVADLVGHAGDRALWRAVIPPLHRACRLDYRVHASTGEQQLASEAFTCDVLGPRSLGPVRQVELHPSAVLLACGDDLTRPTRVQLSFPAPRVVRVDLLPSGVAAPKLDETSVSARVDERGDVVMIQGAGVTLRVARDPYRLVILEPDGRPVLAERSPGPAWVATAGGTPQRASSVFSSPADEAFFGFGERFNALDQRGQTLDILVYEQYKNQGKRTYIPVPFFISSCGYGCYLDTPAYVAYDLAAGQPDRWSYEADLLPGQGLTYYVFVGTPREVLGDFTALTGRPALPPQWAFGLWMSGNEWNDQVTVMEQVRLAEAHDIPAKVLVIEAWSDETTFYIWNDARYEPRPPDQPFHLADFTFPPEGKWPDPQGLIDALHARGIRLILWQIPVMKQLAEPHPQHDLDEAHMIERGYAVTTSTGEPYCVRPFWFHGGKVLDFTNEAAVQWWLSQRAYLLDELGIDGFKTDGGEHLWGDFVFADGSSGMAAANRYPLLYVGAYHRFARTKRPDAITFSRAGFTGCQAYPCHWAGDENSTWEAFRASILAGLSAGASGIPFWGWDIAGFSGEIPSAELYLRATAMACFCPIMQYHSEFNEHRKPSRDRTPWNIQARTGDRDVISVFRKYAQLRMELLPYIYEEARQASVTGIPLMRALPIEFPDDPRARKVPYQYMFGDRLLVAPVVEEGVERQRVYLPAGRWEDFWTGDVHQGPTSIEYPTPKDVIPVFRREAL